MSQPVAPLTQADLSALVDEWHARIAKEPPEQFGDRETRTRVADEMIRSRR